MPKKHKILFFIVVVIDLLLLSAVVFLITKPLPGFNIALFNPKGVIAQKELRLITTAVSLMLVVVIPVYIFTFFIVWKNRRTKISENSAVDEQDSLSTQIVLWAIPVLVIFVLSIINWKSTHDIDPYKPLDSKVKPITIQVVALQWKWLFIYPEQNIATINFIEFPKNTPINFQLTADAPMNSFWIPQLGGQMYAMAGMSTQLRLIANQTGEFPGSAAEINGSGFAGMRFIAKATTQADFDLWVKTVKSSANKLNFDIYNKLSEPSENNPNASYSDVEEGLYNKVMMKFMAPAKQMEGMQ